MSFGFSLFAGLLLIAEAYTYASELQEGKILFKDIFVNNSSGCGFQSTQQAKKGWCCIKGKLIQTTEKECRQQRGIFFSNRDKAEEQCRKEGPFFQDMEEAVTPLKFEFKSAKPAIIIENVNPNPGIKASGGSIPFGRMIALTASRKEKIVG